MPSVEQLLNDLSRAARSGYQVAVAWHYVVAVIVAAVAFRWRPSQRTATWLLGVPLASVSVVSFWLSSPFNAVVFAALAVAHAFGGLQATRQAVTAASGWQRGAGYVLIAFAWFYPHFLQPESVVEYARAAPMGVIPCPTLALVIGAVLLATAAVPRWLALVLSLAGLFYGTFGLLRLGVGIDAVLLSGALLLLVRSSLHAHDDAKGGVLTPTAAP